MKRSKLQILTEISKTSALQKILDLCFELFGNPIVVMDTAMEPMVLTENIPEKSQKEVMELIGGQKRLYNIYQSAAIRKSAKEDMLADETYVCRDKNIPYGRIVKALSEGQTPLGTVVMVEYFKKFDKDDLLYMDMVSSFMTLPLRKKQYKLYGEWSLHQFLVWILAGNKVSFSMQNERASFSDYFKKKYFYLLSIYKLDKENAGEPLKGVLEELSEISDGYCMIYKSRILFFYNSDKKISDWILAVPKLDQILRKWNLYSCISQSFCDYDKLYERFLQTDDMIEIACILRRQSRFLDYNKYTFYEMLDRVPEGVNLREFCDERILDVEEYDKKHRKDLIPTLHTYLENVKSLTRTSELLYIHKNTANYRINKCMELTGCQYETGDEIFAAIYSLRIIEYCNRKLGIPYNEETK